MYGMYYSLKISPESHTMKVVNSGSTALSHTLSEWTEVFRANLMSQYSEGIHIIEEKNADHQPQSDLNSMANSSNLTPFDQLKWGQTAF